MFRAPLIFNGLARRAALVITFTTALAAAAPAMATAAQGGAKSPAASVVAVGDFSHASSGISISTQGSTLDPTPRPVAGGAAMAAVTFAPGAHPTVQLKPAAGHWAWPRGELHVALQNGMAWPVTLVVDVDSDRGSLHAVVGLPPGPPMTLAIPLAATSPRAFGMQVGPPNPWRGSIVATTVEGSFDAGAARAVRLSMPAPNAPQVVLFGAVSVAAGTPALDAAYSNIVDTYGQYTRSTWPEKIADDAALKKAARTADPTSPAVPGYGGVARPGLKATGWFGVVKSQGAWTMVTPDGKAFFSLGVNAVAIDGGMTYVEGRKGMFQDLPPANGPLSKFYGKGDDRSDNGSQRDNGKNHGQWFDFYRANLQRTYGDAWPAMWAKVTLDRLRGWGFNTLGNWSDPSLFTAHRIAYTVPVLITGDFASVSTGYDYWGRMPDPFDTRFAAAATAAAAKASKGVRDDPWLLGYFADNELAWAGQGPQGRWGLATGALKLGPGSPAKQAFVASLRKKYSDAGKLGAAWGVALASWDQLLAANFNAPVPAEAHPAIAADYIDFLTLYAETYFRTVAAALKKADPHHLFLGGRLAVRTPEVEAACARYCDVVSINAYADLPEHGLDVAAFKRMDKPVMVTEFHFGSADRGPFGNGVAAVANEAERGKAYARFVDAAKASGVIVGTHWFDFADQPVTGRILDGENSHIGLVGITDIPFAGFVQDVTKANRRAAGK
jgi:hypothetical protein